jgi:hypothetical protein
VFTVPKAFVSPPTWKIVGLWLGIGLFETLISPWVMRLVFAIFPSNRPDSASILIGIAGIYQALILYSLQWLVLRRYFPGMRWWVAAHVTATFIAVLLNDVLQRLMSALIAVFGYFRHSITLMEQYQVLGSTIVSMVWALIFGIIGWRIFRASAAGAGRWIWAKLGGQLINRLVTFGFLLPFWTANSGQPYPLTLRLIVYAGVLAAFSIEAFVLVQFLNKRQAGVINGSYDHAITKG